MKRQKKRAITLLEIMIVIFLIGIIGSVIGYNMKGSLDEGKAFKTRQGKSQIEDILLLTLSEGVSVDDILADPAGCLALSGLCKDPKKMLTDGWGAPYEIKEENGVIEAVSKNLEMFDAKKNAKIDKSSQGASATANGKAKKASK